MASSGNTTVANPAGDGAAGGLLARFEIRIVDTSEKRPVHMLVARNGGCIRLSSSAFGLLRHVDQGHSFEEIAAALSERDGKPTSAAEVETAYRSVIERIEQIEARGNPLASSFWFKRRILPGWLVAAVARPLSLAFHPVAMAVFLAVIAASLVYLGQTGMRFDPGHFWPGYGLLLLSLIAHEFGHASACARHGAEPSDIGFTFYLIYPAFYSDVNAAWTLRRWQRVMVDLGGVYFQMVVGAVYLAAFALWGWEPLRVAVVLILGNCLFSLNPILRFDGYWVVADALGVTNLGRQPARMWSHFSARLRGEPAPPLPWPGIVIAVLSIYSVLAFLVWGWFLAVIVPMLGTQIMRAVHSGTLLVQQVVTGSSWPDMALVGRVITSTFMSLFVVIMVWRLLRGLWKRVRRFAGTWMSNARGETRNDALGRGENIVEDTPKP